MQRSEIKLEIKSLYELISPTTNLSNNIGQYMVIGVGAFAVLLILFAPNGKKR